VPRVLGLVLALAASASAAPLSGTLTGDWAKWGPAVSVEALTSRDFAVSPAATAVVATDGSFELQLPDDVTSVYLALWPGPGAAYPILLKELPFTVPPATPIVIPLPAPPQERAQRQSIAAPSYLAVGGAALALLVLIVWAGRRALALRLERLPDTHADRWIPKAMTPSHGGPLLWATIASVGGLLLYGVLALDEALDLLEYTYFQEAYAGDNPLAIAFSPVVAERAHAPGYAVLLWAMTRLSDAEAWLRVPAVLAALAGAWMLFRLTADATGSKKAGWLAALLGAMTPLAMRYARDVTPYSLVGMLAVASTWLLYRAIVTGARREWGAWAAVSAGAFFLHYFTAFLVIGQAVAGLWLFVRGGRGPFWTQRFRQALLAFGIVGVLPLAWSAQVIRAFIISAQDNLVTHAVYPEAPGFLPYCADHLRVLMGLPGDLAWAVWPLLLLLIAGYVFLLRDHPTFGRLLLIPFILLVGLLITTYALHNMAYGGHVYYGWRWLRPYTPAVVIPVAYLLARPLPNAARAAAWSLGAVMIACTLYSGVSSAITRERPAQRAAAEKLLEQARDSDAIGVLPAAFYTVGWTYYLQQHSKKRHVHAGPAFWRYYPMPDGGHKRIFGPIRSFGIPLESIAGHIDVHRLWVTVFDEIIFDQPEFDATLPEHVLEGIDGTMKRLKRWTFPHMSLVLYERRDDSFWLDGPVLIDTQRLYRSLRYMPEALEPEDLVRVVRGELPVRLRVPKPQGSDRVGLTVRGAPEGADENLVRMEQSVSETQPNVIDITIHRSAAGRAAPLVLELTP